MSFVDCFGMYNRKISFGMFYFGVAFAFLGASFMIFDLFHISLRVVFGIVGVVLIGASGYRILK